MKTIILPKNDSNNTIDIANINSETNGIILTYKDNDCVGYVTYNDNDDIWGFSQNINIGEIPSIFDNYLINILNKLIKNGIANNFKLEEFK